jgi:phosphotransferase system  glucose/maltose/N-acetylglucosamine-specific IIC component
MPGARFGRVLMILIAVIVIAGLVLGTVAAPFGN